MKKNIKYTIIAGGVAISSLVFGGVVSSNIYIGETSVPMAGENTIIEEEPTIVEPVGEVETPAEEPQVILDEGETNEISYYTGSSPIPYVPDENLPEKNPDEMTREEKCERFSNFLIRVYGTTDFYEALASRNDGLTGEQLKALGLETWEQVKTAFARAHRPLGTAITHKELKPLLDFEPTYNFLCGNN